MTSSIENQLGSVTLYERLGASAGIRTLVDEAVDVLLKNPTLQLRFLTCLERRGSLADIKQQVCVFVSARSGGPDIDQGRRMTEALCGLNIEDAEYSAAVKDIISTMATCGYDDSTRSEVLAILSFMKADIVPA